MFITRAGTRPLPLALLVALAMTASVLTLAGTAHAQVEATPSEDAQTAVDPDEGQTDPPDAGGSEPGRSQVVPDLPEDSPSSGDEAGGGFADHGRIASVHRTAVYELVDQQVVRGCGDGSAYCPADGVTREQMASFIGRALGLTPVLARRFEDVGPSSTHGGYIGALADAGITGGCDEEGTSYCPRDTVTREQMASFLQRAYQLLGIGGPTFEDAIGGTHAVGIAGVAASRVTTGCTTTEFCPRDTVTREQMASFIARAMGLLRDSRGCPTTLGPERLPTGSAGGAPALTSFGTAAEGFPVNSAERIGDKLYVFSLDLSPSRMVIYDLTTATVERVVNIPNGRRTWAVHAPDPDGNLLYFGQDATQNNLYRFNTSTGALTQIGSITGITEMWDITSDDQGRIYVGTSRHRTVYRHTPGSSGLEQLTFAGAGGQSLNGHVTQLAWDDGLLYVGTGRTSNSNGDDARLVAVPTDGWTTGTTATAHRLPGIGSGFGVYDLTVSDGLIVAGLERWPYPSNNAALAVYDRPDDTEGLTVEEQVAALSLRGDELILPPVSESAFTSVAINPAEPDEDDDGDGDDNGNGGGDNGAGTGDTAGDEVYAAGRSTGTIYDLAPEATALVPRFAEPPAPESPTRALLIYGDELLGAAAPATVWRDPIARDDLDETEHEPAIYNLVDAGAPSQPSRPQSLAAGAGHVAVGSNNSITLHRETASKRTAAVPGEPKVMQVIDDQMFVGLYPTATLRQIALSGVYAGATVEDWDNTFGRPTDVHHDSNGSGGLLLSAQVTTNSGARGAVVNYALSPPGLVSQYRQPPSERGAAAITTWGSQTIVAGTGESSRVASRPTSATSGDNPLWSTLPVPGGGNINGLVTVGDLVHGMTHDGRWFTLDPNRNGALMQSRQVFDGTTGRIVAHGDWIYAVTRDCLVAIDTERMRTETLHGSLAANTFGLHTVAVDADSIAGNADVYAIRGDDLIRFRHQQR